jgi:peroxiredoxin Q/BCP
MMDIGNKLPRLKVTITDGTESEVRLDELEAKFIILFFYPKDLTPGCTIENQNFRDAKTKFDMIGAMLFGISRDPIGSHKKFIDKHDLNFPLISDSDEKLCRKFDVIKEKNMYGKKVMGIERSTFIFDSNKQLIKMWRKVKVTNHVNQVLAFIS